MNFDAGKRGVELVTRLWVSRNLRGSVCNLRMNSDGEVIRRFNADRRRFSEGDFGWELVVGVSRSGS